MAKEAMLCNLFEVVYNLRNRKNRSSNDLESGKCISLSEIVDRKEAESKVQLHAYSLKFTPKIDKNTFLKYRKDLLVEPEHDDFLEGEDDETQNQLLKRLGDSARFLKPNSIMPNHYVYAFEKLEASFTLD